MNSRVSFLFFVVILAAAVAGSVDTSVETNPAYVCSFCLVLFGLVEESIYQVHLQTFLEGKCSSTACKKAVEHIVLQAEAGKVPESICRNVGMCNDTCSLFPVWPVNPIPEQPIDWPIERRHRQLDETSSDSPSEEGMAEVKEILTELVVSAKVGAKDIPMMGVVAAALSEFHRHAKAKTLQAAEAMESKEVIVGSTDKFAPCGMLNVTCHIYNFVEGHLPLQDFDSDRFAPASSRTMRGSDWRGADCDDMRRDVYPGRRSTIHEAGVDHNCNGIMGGNETGTYEDLFCKNSQQRGLIMLGDSATAHFHIPPQWLTAAGWNLDQLLPDAENELDQPHCSWGTAHGVTPEDCPYMAPVPGIPDNEIISIYSQLRDRNRCNHNDFQNIGVNGARMTSSMKLVDSMGRSQDLDHPALVWLALIGNDVCNGHPGYDHMTTPDEFYSHAMETLTALDQQLPAGSHVVALALFDGELLYDTMHARQHPVGSTYEDFYDLMNCEEENPCWGWLNSDREVRANTTKISNSLNDVYQNISDTQTFQNFKFIFYDPSWVKLFSDYAAAGNDMADLIEPSDGFHPSQAGNGLFAQKFFEYLDKFHPEALGPVNPHNEEIDRLFFSTTATSAAAAAADPAK